MITEAVLMSPSVLTSVYNAWNC